MRISWRKTAHPQPRAAAASGHSSTLESSTVFLSIRRQKSFCIRNWGREEKQAREEGEEGGKVP